ncbi:MAG: hypothetical protein R6U66_08190 [Bacteroidales bacterium]
MTGFKKRNGFYQAPQLHQSALLAVGGWQTNGLSLNLYLYALFPRVSMSPSLRLYLAVYSFSCLVSLSASTSTSISTSISTLPFSIVSASIWLFSRLVV